MFKKEIFKIKNYDLIEVHKNVYASPASFKLDLRNACKNNLLYFSKNIKKYNKNIKNFGCFIFGQPNTWKGIFGMFYQKIKEKNKSDIIIYIEEYRIPQSKDEKLEEKVITLIENGLEYLKNERVVENFKKLF